MMRLNRPMTRFSFFARPRQDGRFHIRPTRESDEYAVDRLLRQARLCSVALEWWSAREWLTHPGFLVLTDRRDRPVALALAAADDSPVAWLRAVAADSERLLPALLEASLQATMAQACSALAALGAQNWLLTPIQRLGFRQVNRVVTLRLNRPWQFQTGPAALRVRPATGADLPGIAAVDRAAFEPLWWYSLQMLERGLDLAHCFHAVLVGSECVGYQFSTLRNGRGHIVRLAVHPRWQGQGIGARLLGEALTALRRAGAEEITVNTQENNWPSLKLYRTFGFDPTGDSWTVWLRSWTTCDARAEQL
jgi:ribosomal protein S18 acetylase RimI-like enzyme